MDDEDDDEDDDDLSDLPDFPDLPEDQSGLGGDLDQVEGLEDLEGTNLQLNHDNSNLNPDGQTDERKSRIYGLFRIYLI